MKPPFQKDRKKLDLQKLKDWKKFQQQDEKEQRGIGRKQNIVGSMAAKAIARTKMPCPYASRDGR